MSEEEDRKITKVAEDDPLRCQCTQTQYGQCMNKACEDSDYCIIHGGQHAINKRKKEKLRNYILTKHQARIERHKTAPDIKSLRDEVAILRMLMEERLNHCKDDMDLILHSGPISDLVMKIDKLVNSCHKLEGSLGQLLDKQAILTFASEVITVITDNLDDPVKIDAISNGIMEIVGRIGKEDESD